jgi:hypothetical protein
MCFGFYSTACGNNIVMSGLKNKTNPKEMKIDG